MGILGCGWGSTDRGFPEQGREPEQVYSHCHWGEFTGTLSSGNGNGSIISPREDVRIRGQLKTSPDAQRKDTAGMCTVKMPPEHHLLSQELRTQQGQSWIAGQGLRSGYLRRVSVRSTAVPTRVLGMTLRMQWSHKFGCIPHPSYNVKSAWACDQVWIELKVPFFFGKQKTQEP